MHVYFLFVCLFIFCVGELSFPGSPVVAAGDLGRAHRSLGCTPKMSGKRRQGREGFLELGA